MNSQSTTPNMFQAGLTNAGRSTHVPHPQTPFPELKAGKSKHGRPAPQPSEAPLLTPDGEMLEDAGLGAMTGLGAAMLFNAGVVIAGLVGWEVWLMVR